VARDDKRPPLLRKCTSKIPSVQQNFQMLMEHQVLKHNLLHQIDLLHQSAVTNGCFTKLEEAEYERIEDRIQRATKYADKRC
jgi:hypothetical protein